MFDDDEVTDVEIFVPPLDLAELRANEKPTRPIRRLRRDTRPYVFPRTVTIAIGGGG